MPNPGAEFASGFTRGLANALNQKRKDATERDERQRQMSQQALQAIIPFASDPRDIFESPMFAHAFGLDQQTGKKGGGKKGQPDPMAIIQSVLGPALQGNGAPPSATGSAPSDHPLATPTPAPTGVPGAPPALAASGHPALVSPSARPVPTPSAPAGRSVLGINMLSPDEIASHKALRDVRTDLEGRQARQQFAIERLLPAIREANPGISLKDAIHKAMLQAGLDEDKITSGASGTRYGGIMKGDQIGDGETDTSGRPIDKNGFYRAQIQADGSFMYIPTIAPGDLGDYVERAAKALGFVNASTAAAAGKMNEVNAGAQKLREQDAKATGTGSAQAAYEKPIGIAESQTTQVPVGTRAPQVAGQVVPTQEQQGAGRTTLTLRGDIARILGDGTDAHPGLLGVLPSKDELAGMVPGGTMAIRRRSNAYREDIRKLEAVVDGMVNDLARYRGQRGAQTEGDVERAYNALVKLKAGFGDFFGGDTQESARAAIEEAKAGLERVAATIVPPVVPSDPAKQPAQSTTPAPTQAAPVTGGRGAVPLPTGFEYDANGRIVIKQ